MKKLISFLLCLTLALGYIPTVAYAVGEEATFTVIVDKSTLYADAPVAERKVEVTVMAEATFQAGEFVLEYDDSVFTYNDFEGQPNGKLEFVQFNQDGKMKFNGFKEFNYTYENEPMCKFIFTVNDSISSNSVNCSFKLVLEKKGDLFLTISDEAVPFDGELTLVPANVTVHKTKEPPTPEPPTPRPPSPSRPTSNNPSTTATPEKEEEKIEDPIENTVEKPTETEKPVDKTIEPEENINNVVFIDIDNVAWAASAINRLASLGLISGIGNNQFAPNRNVTRAEFTQIIVKALNLEQKDEPVSFSDVNTNDWYYNAVVIAKQHGIINGYPDGTFAPKQNITRQDMCVMINNALKLSSIQAPNTTPNFVDTDKISNYAKEAVAVIQALSIITGFSDGTFRPMQMTTRAQTAVMVGKVLDIE